MSENRFETKIEGIEKDDAKKIVNYRKAQEKMKEFLKKTEADDKMPKEIMELDPLELENKTITSFDIEKVGDIVEKSQDKELVERLTVGLEKEEKEFRKKEIENLILDYKKEIEGIRDKLKTFKNDKSLDESGKNKLEEDREKVEKLELKIKNSEDELRKLE